MSTEPDNAPVFFNVEHVTKAGATIVARGVSRAEAQAFLDLARIERVAGRCTRVYLTSRASAPGLLPARVSWQRNRPRAVPLSEKQRAEIMAEDEGIDSPRSTRA